MNRLQLMRIKDAADEIKPSFDEFKNEWMAAHSEKHPLLTNKQNCLDAFWAGVMFYAAVKEDADLLSLMKARDFRDGRMKRAHDAFFAAWQKLNDRALLVFMDTGFCMAIDIFGLDGDGSAVLAGLDKYLVVEAPQYKKTH